MTLQQLRYFLAVAEEQQDAPGRRSQRDGRVGQFGQGVPVGFHRPLGDLNRARRDIYSAMAAFRADAATCSNFTRPAAVAVPRT